MQLAGPQPTQRKWLPVFAVVGVILLVVGGGLVAAASVIEPVEVVQVAPGVEVTPADGWAVEGGGEDPPHVRLTTGSASLDVAVFDAPGATAVDLLAVYVRDVLEPDASQLEVGSPREVDLPNGGAVVVVGYVGVFQGVAAPVEGEVFAVPTSDGRGVVFDAWAQEGGLAPAYDDVLEMVEGTTIP